MEDAQARLLLLVEEDARCWDEAALLWESFANLIPDATKAEYDLVCAVYRERAKLHRDAAAKARSAGAATQP
jgi:hypothetical protein